MPADWIIEGVDVSGGAREVRLVPTEPAGDRYLCFLNTRLARGTWEINAEGWNTTDESDPRYRLVLVNEGVRRLTVRPTPDKPFPVRITLTKQIANQRLEILVQVTAFDKAQERWLLEEGEY